MKKTLLSLWLAVVVCAAFAQQRTVTGKVTSSEDGSSLPGVNVVVKGTTNGTVTDTDGKYSLSITSASDILVFSFIGLKTAEISVGEKALVDVQLNSDVTQLSEIVVTGTGVATEKRKLAISVETLTSDKFPVAPTASIDQALVGRIAGAQISSVDGTPGASVNILLRGVNSINQSTSPMILIDGVQMGSTNLNAIDMNTIDRVEVVQGAAAATIYGAQGANGVIQLFSKKGKKGRMNIDFSSSVTQNSLINEGNVRKSRLHNFSTDASGNLISGANPITINPNTFTYSGNVGYNALDPNGKADKPYVGNFQYIDHFAKYLVPANTINNSLAISGAGEKSDFSISVANNHQESNFKGDGFNDRTNFTSNIGFEVVKGLELRSITQLVYTKNTINWWNQAGFGGGGIIYNLLNTRPFVDYDLKDADGNYGYRMGDAGGVNGRNPNYRYQYSNRYENIIDVIQSFSATYKFPKFVEVSAKYGINYQSRDEQNLIENQTANRNSVANGQNGILAWFNSTRQGEVDNYDTKNTFQNFLASLTGTFDFEKDLKINVPIKSTTIATFDWRRNELHTYYTYGLDLPTYKPYNASQASSYRINNDTRTPFVTYGYLINQRFEYGDFFGVSGGFRSDYSSAFGAGSKPFTFPRGDAFLRFSGLDFWDNIGLSKTILEFKIRAAYGQAGIQPRPFDRYVTLGTAILGTGNAFFYPNAQPNANLDVEVSEEKEYGVDMTLDLSKGAWFKNLNLSFTYWNRATKNAIYNVDRSPSSGVGTLRNNAFSLGSQGFQFTLNTAVLSTPTINWNFTTNFGRQYSEITNVADNAEVVVTSNAGSSNYVLRAGEAVGQLYGFKMLRSVDQTDKNGNPYISVANQGNYEVASNGYVVNKTTKQPIATSDQTSLGNSFPKFNASFINEVTYKNFLTLSVQFDWVYKSHLYNQTKSWMYRDGIHSDYEKPVTINGEAGAWTAFYRGVYQAGANNGTKDYFYEDATFLRLRNISVGVDFAKVYKLPAFRKLQLVLTGRNILTITDYTGFDPETSSGSTNSAFDRGVDHNTMPNLKSYQVALNIGF
jgi:TonB-dependent starch-binding outer membrane protein SusC